MRKAEDSRVKRLKRSCERKKKELKGERGREIRSKESERNIKDVDRMKNAEMRNREKDKREL